VSEERAQRWGALTRISWPGDFSFEEVRYQAYVEGQAGRFAQQIELEKQQVLRMQEEKLKLVKNPYHFTQPPGPGAPMMGAGGGGAPPMMQQPSPIAPGAGWGAGVSPNTSAGGGYAW